MKRPIRFIIIAVVLIATAVVVIVSSRNSTVKQETPSLTPDSSALNVEVPVVGFRLEPGGFQEILKANGVLEAQYRSLLSSETGGRVANWTAEIGERLAEGDVILEFDNELAALGVRQAEANLESARIAAAKQQRDSERFKKLHEQGDLSKNEFETTELARLSADAALAGAEAAAGMTQRSFNETQVRMPFRGRLASKLVEIGQSLLPGTPVAEVVSINPIRLMVGVSEEDLVRIKPGQDVIVRTVGWKERVFNGKVHAVGIAADMATRQFPVEIHLPNPKVALKPGMAATAEIIIKSYKDVLVVPRDAVNFEGKKTTLYMVADNRAQLKEIYVRALNDRQVMIESGVKIGDTVIIFGQGGIKSGQRVSVRIKDEG